MELKDIKAVSDIEKKPDNTNNIINKIISPV